MKYFVVEAFVDLQDSDHLYRVGDEYPRPGKGVSAERISELASDKNLLGKPLIAEGKKESKPEPEAKPEGLTAEEVEAMPYFTLKAEAKKRGISVEGKKAPVLREELIAAL